LSVCPSDYSQTCERVLTKFFGGVGHGSRTKWYNFGGDPDHASDSGVQSPKSGSSGSAEVCALWVLLVLNTSVISPHNSSVLSSLPHFHEQLPLCRWHSTPFFHRTFMSLAFNSPSRCSSVDIYLFMDECKSFNSHLFKDWIPMITTCQNAIKYHSVWSQSWLHLWRTLHLLRSDLIFLYILKFVNSAQLNRTLWT